MRTLSFSLCAILVICSIVCKAQKECEIILHSKYGNGKEYYMEVELSKHAERLTGLKAPVPRFYLSLDILSDYSWVAQETCVEGNVDPLMPKISCPFKHMYVMDGEPHASGPYTLTGFPADPYNVTGDKYILDMSIPRKNDVPLELESIDFMLASTTTNVNGMYMSSGVLGLSLRSYWFPDKHPTKPKYNLLRSLKDSNIIPKGRISIYYDNFEHASYLIMGGTHGTIIPDESKIVWEASSNTQEWEVDIKSTTVSSPYSLDTHVKTSFKGELNTRVHFLGVPMEDYEAIIKHFPCSGYSTPSSECLVTLPLYDAFPTFTIELASGNIYKLLPEDYIRFVSYTQHQFRADIQLRPTPQSSWLFGTSVLRHYYTILDYETKNFAFYDIGRENYVEVSSYFNLSYELVMIVSIVLVALLLIIIIISVVVCCCFKPNPEGLPIHRYAEIPMRKIIT